MNKQLTPLFDSDFFAPIDVHFADFIQEISGCSDFEIRLASALVSWSTRMGNVCLDLNKIADNPAVKKALPDKFILFQNINEWIDHLTKCSAIGKAEDYKPLVLDSRNRLYFYRYWEYEKTITDAINDRIQSHIKNIDYQKLKEGVNRVFDSGETNEIDLQKVASICALLNRFSVISGGPGTGKTTTVAKILALLIEQAGKNDINIILCAPTGKAAASLSETIRSVKSRINCDDFVKDSMPDEAFTIHRLLKTIPGSPYFRHNTDNSIQADVLIIDEASMVDIALMAKLFNAIPNKAQIILIGDKDQLSSVEAGSVLGDICNRELNHNISKETVNWIQTFIKSGNNQLPDLSFPQQSIQDHIIVLDKNYRFDENNGIGGLSNAVNQGDSETCFQLLMNSSDKNVRFQEIAEPKTLYKALGEIVVERYFQYLSANEPNQALDLFHQFKILCALRFGPFGVDTINRLVQKILLENGLIQIDKNDSDRVYKGRPILITRNDYSLGLFNGDTGIIMPIQKGDNNDFHAVFPIIKDEIKYVPIHRLPEHETAFAMTMHKSQGSEFNDVLIVLPDQYYPILTRELIYTGITRAINSVAIWGKKDVLEEAIANKIERTSGLRDALWGL